MMIAEMIRKHEKEILNEWLNDQFQLAHERNGLTPDLDLRPQSSKFLSLFLKAVELNLQGDFTQSAWQDMREFLHELSHSHLRQGFRPTDLATFIFSLKRPLFQGIQGEMEQTDQRASDGLWQITSLLEKLGLYTTEVFQKGREAGINGPDGVDLDHASAQLHVLNGLRVLLVESSTTSHVPIQAMLTTWGAKVDLAHDGRQCLIMAMNGDYQLILMDVQMPDMDGCEATARLRHAGHRGAIVALSAHAIAQERERCLKSGFNYFLARPLDKTELLRLLLSLEQKLEAESEQAGPNPGILKTILLVEDDIDTREMVTEILQECSYQVIASPTAYEALNLLEANLRPDLILLDLTLPGLSGAEFLGILRGRPEWANYKVVISSGWDHLQQRAEELKADSYLRKPYNLNTIIDEVAKNIRA